MGAIDSFLFRLRLCAFAALLVISTIHAHASESDDWLHGWIQKNLDFQKDQSGEDALSIRTTEVRAFIITEDTEVNKLLVLRSPL